MSEEKNFDGQITGTPVVRILAVDGNRVRIAIEVWDESGIVLGGCEFDTLGEIGDCFVATGATVKVPTSGRKDPPEYVIEPDSLSTVQ